MYKKNRGYPTINIEQIAQQVTAIEPCYGEEGGNATRIYTANGQVHTVPNRLHTVLKNIAAFYSCNLTDLRKKYSNLLQATQSLPLPLSFNLVLIPLKTRTPKFEQDGATAFVSLCAIKAVTPVLSTVGSKHCCRIDLEGGTHLNVLYSESCIEKRKKNGRIVQNNYYSIHSLPNLNGATLVMDSANNEVPENAAATGCFRCELLIDYQPQNDAAGKPGQLQKKNSFPAYPIILKAIKVPY
jgi:hypothetical protein